MEIDTLLDLMRRRRSARRFKPDPIPDEHIQKILEAGRWAMSGANGQPWEFVVVKDRDLIQEVARIRRDCQKHTRVMEESRVKELRHAAYLVPANEMPGFKDAPVVIVICGDPRVYQATVVAAHFYAGDGGPMATFHKSIGNATQFIHLAAAVFGLGAQWISVDSTWEGQLKRLLDIPEMLSVQTIVPIGYPHHKPAPPFRRKLDEMVHYDKYDSAKFRTDEQIQEYIADLRRRSLPAYQA
ncbi:MAG: nitroreductase family protein [Chloroflexi bacterium]|nr:nitroreductase family protein [Chloroflexota bacterium]